LLLAASWEVVHRAGLVDRFLFPSLLEIGTSLVGSLASGRLPAALAISLARGLAGYLIAGVLAVSLGLLAGRFPLVQRSIGPLVEFLRPLPSVALLPLAILLLGIGNAMKVFLVAWACFFPILVNTIDGVRGVPTALLDTAQNLGLGRTRAIVSVVLPCASPAIATGLRVALSLMLVLVVVSEMVAGNSGIGFLIVEAERGFRVPEMYALLLALAVLGLALNQVFLLADRRLLRWYHAAHARPPA
jgi:ABC-type nitrate/sulfonate/bicarbonate transport system permease component